MMIGEEMVLSLTSGDDGRVALVAVFGLGVRCELVDDFFAGGVMDEGLDVRVLFPFLGVFISAEKSL